MVDLLFRHPSWTHEVWYIRNGSRTFQDFVDELEATGVFAAKIRDDEALADRPLSPEEWRHLIQTIKKVAEHGFRKMITTDMVDRWKEDDDTPVNEIRKGQVRILFFPDKPEGDNQEIILTHGFLKKGDETPDEEIKHYKNLREDYFEWKFEAQE